MKYYIVTVYFETIRHHTIYAHVILIDENNDEKTDKKLLAIDEYIGELIYKNKYDNVEKFKTEIAYFGSYENDYKEPGIVGDSSIEKKYEIKRDIVINHPEVQLITDNLDIYLRR